MFVLGTAHGPALAQSPGGYPGAGTDAGYYGLATYSGGTVTAVNGSTTPFAPIDSENYQGSGSANAGTDYTTGASKSCSVNVSGPLTAKFQWVPTVPSDTSTPSGTIVVQTATVSWNATVGGNATASGSIDPGTGNPIPPPTSLYSQSWTDSKYSVEGGGSTVTVSMTPVASFGGGTVANKYDSYLYGGASVTYKAHVYVPFIKISGTNPANQALTGQQIGAHLDTNGALITITSYTWSFTGGTPIKNWDGDGTALDRVTPQQLFPLTSTDLTGTDTSTNHTGITVADLSFYDQAAENVTVKCVINFTLPKDANGNTQSGTLTVTSKPVNFLKPTASWTTNQSSPGAGAYFDQTGMGAIELWDVNITVPSPFSGGTGCFAQIVTPTIQFQRYALNNQPSLCYLKEPQTNPDGTTTYVLPSTGLDSFFPYPIGASTGPSTLQPYANGYQWNVTGSGHSGDTPFASFSILAADNGGNNWYTAYASEIFTTWLMYQPSSGGTGPPIWVPLQRIDWNWTGNVVKNAATGQWNSAINGNPPVSVSSSTVGITTDTPPQWTTVNIGGPLRP